LLILNKAEFPEELTWWKKHMRSSFHIDLETWQFRDSWKFSINNTGKKLYIYICFPFKLFFWLFCIVPSSFFYHFIFDDIQDNCPADLPTKEKILFHLRVWPQVILHLLCCLLFFFIGAMPFGFLAILALTVFTFLTQ